MSIRKSILCGVGLVLCASLALAESVRVKSTNVNLRSAPMSTAKIVGKVPHGKILEVIEVSGMWTRVTDGHMTGWVNSALVERVAEAPAATASSETRSSGASSSSQPARRAPARRAAATPEEKPLNLAVNLDYQNNDANLGVGGRVFFSPAASMPALRIMGGFDLFPMGSNDLPTLIDITANGVYEFRNASPELTPYVGAGLVWSHISGGSSTDFNITGGVVYKKRFFGDVRIVLSDGTPIILSVGARF